MTMTYSRIAARELIAPIVGGRSVHEVKPAGGTR